MEHSRAYIAFNTAEDVYDFKARFDGHVFQSSRGTQYKCAVEYAPFQKVPVAEAKQHPLEGTIDKGAQVAGTHAARGPLHWVGGCILRLCVGGEVHCPRAGEGARRGIWQAEGQECTLSVPHDCTMAVPCPTQPATNAHAKQRLPRTHLHAPPPAPRQTPTTFASWSSWKRGPRRHPPRSRSGRPRSAAGRCPRPARTPPRAAP